MYTINVKLLIEDIKKVRDSLEYQSENWHALNDIIIELSFIPENEDVKKDFTG